MFNKTGNANHTATKFVVNILYVIGSLCSKVGHNRFIFKKVTKKMDPSSQN